MNKQWRRRRKDKWRGQPGGWRGGCQALCDSQQQQCSWTIPSSQLPAIYHFLSSSGEPAVCFLHQNIKLLFKVNSASIFKLLKIFWSLFIWKKKQNFLRTQTKRRADLETPWPGRLLRGWRHVAPRKCTLAQIIRWCFGDFVLISHQSRLVVCVALPESLKRIICGERSRGVSVRSLWRNWTLVNLLRDPSTGTMELSRTHFSSKWNTKPTMENHQRWKMSLHYLIYPQVEIRLHTKKQKSVWTCCLYEGTAKQKVVFFLLRGCQHTLSPPYVDYLSTI